MLSDEFSADWFGGGWVVDGGLVCDVLANGWTVGGVSVDDRLGSGVLVEVDVAVDLGLSDRKSVV